MTISFGSPLRKRKGLDPPSLDADDPISQLGRMFVQVRCHVNVVSVASALPAVSV